MGIPLISIIVPVYNAEKYLLQCIKSIQKQTYKKIEIICVNDASTDNSLRILQKIQNTDQRIKIIDKVNEGVSKARNDGLNASSGELVMFVDADDWIELETCEKALAVMQKNNADVVMWSYISETEGRASKKAIFPNTRVFSNEKVKTLLHRRFIGIVDEELSHPELADSLCPVWGKLYKRSLILQSDAKFIDLDKIGTYEDGLFNLQVFGYAHKVVYLSEYFYHYRRSTESSVTYGYRKKLFDQWQNLFNIMSKYIAENKLPDSYKQALNNRIALSILGLGLNELSSDKTSIGKIEEIKRIISLPEYRNAYAKLDYSYFPVHWKVFYGFAKYRLVFPLWCLLIVICMIIGR